MRTEPPTAGFEFGMSATAWKDGIQQGALFSPWYCSPCTDSSGATRNPVDRRDQEDRDPLLCDMERDGNDMLLLRVRDID